MQRKERATGTNREFAHHTAKPTREAKISDRALLRRAERDARKWQARLEQQRRGN